jgi:hypothetical protein
LGLNGLGSADKTGLKNGQKSGRPFRIVAGQALSSTAFRLASFSLDPEFAARIARANAHYFEALAKSKRKAARLAVVKKRTPPVNVLDGYRFPSVPVIDLSPTDPPPQWAITSRWKPTGAGADVPDIPEFLKRATAVMPTRRSQEAAAVPGDDLGSWSERGKVSRANPEADPTKVAVT